MFRKKPPDQDPIGQIVTLQAQGARELANLMTSAEAVLRRVLTATGTLEAFQSNSESELVLTVALRTGKARIQWRERPADRFETLAELGLGPTNLQ